YLIIVVPYREATTFASRVASIINRRSSPLRWAADDARSSLAPARRICLEGQHCFGGHQHALYRRARIQISLPARVLGPGCRMSLRAIRNGGRGGQRKDQTSVPVGLQALAQRS